MNIVVQVALPIKVFYTFDYLANSNTTNITNLVPGIRVSVPFRNRKMIGIIVGINQNSKLARTKLKHIDKILDNESLFSAALWKTLLWGAKYYHYPLGKVLYFSLPILLRKGNNIKTYTRWKYIINNTGINEIKNLKSTTKKFHMLSTLSHGPLFTDQLKLYSFNKSILKSLHDNGLCELQEHKLEISNWHSTFRVKENNIKLNKLQNYTVKKICKNNNLYSAWLLTGSDGIEKTEIYFSIIENILKNGRQILILVPEIRMTKQMITLFHSYFNAPIDIVHSSLGNQEQLNVWLRARTGKNAIIIGTRSAVFTPLAHPGMIIIDEEHDQSYKQQELWRYHARDLAVIRAYKENIPILMSSVTPTLEALHNVNNKKYFHINLNKNTNQDKRVFKSLLDLKGQKLISGLTSILIYKIHQHLKCNNQVLIFLNRRGVSPILMCHDCGWLAECSNCSSNYTLHHEYLQCHYCSNKIHLLIQCQKCSSTHLRAIGIGTEQLEEQLCTLFPNIPISRIDRDITNKRSTLEKYLIDIPREGARIMIGTQMLIKGDNFPNVSLVSFLNIDNALFSTDFRSMEHFAQLYTQLANFAKNSKRNSEILLQTYYPHHPLLQILLYRGYLSFAKQTLLERNIADLPPWSSHAIFRTEGTDNQTVENFLNQVRHLLESSFLKGKSTSWIMGPIPAVLHKCRKRFRWQLIIKDQSRNGLYYLLKQSLPLILKLHMLHKVKWSLDVDPIEY